MSKKMTAANGYPAHVEKNGRVVGKPDNSISIAYTFEPREANQYGCDLLILTATFRGYERAASWRDAMAKKIKDQSAGVLQVSTLSTKLIGSWECVVLMRPTIEQQLVAAAVRQGAKANIKTVETQETGFPKTTFAGVK